MRRLLAALSLALVLPVAPSSAVAPPALPDVVPGRVTLGPVPRSERLLRAYESLAVTKESRDLLRRFVPLLAKADSGEDMRLSSAVPIEDFDGDHVGDVLMFDMLVWNREVWVEGDTHLALFSGRTGRRLWARSFEDMALPMLYATNVGNGRRGIVAIQLVGQDFDEFGYRVVALGGTRGETVYDTTITPADGLGDVYFGGFFDANPGGGTDMLWARVEHIVTIGFSVDGVWPPGIDRTQVFVLDGRDGKVRAVTDRELVVGGWPAFAAVGDLDGDRRDDFVVFRRGIREANGTATARSVVENKIIWQSLDVPLGFAIGLISRTDSVGDRRPDVLYLTWLSGASPVPDTGLPALPREPSKGIYAVWLDGANGMRRNMYTDGSLLTLYWPIRDVDGDGKVDLVSSGLDPKAWRTDMTFALLTKAGTVRRWLRTITVQTGLPVASSASAWSEDAGDVDGDGWPDTRYVLSARGAASTRTVMGYVLQRDGRAFASTDVPLGGTLDGRGTDRVTYALKGDRQTFTMRDGRTGHGWWQVSTTSRSLLFSVEALDGQRGRCDGVLLVGSPETKEAAGQVWAAMLDGGTGRVRWARPLNLSPRAPALTGPAGPPVACR